MKLENVFKHLVSGVAVYGLVAACSGSESTGSHAPGAGGHGGAVADAFMDAVTGNGGQSSDAFVDRAADVLDALTEPVTDANAAEGGCGTCTVAGPLKVVTADTDPAQMLGGHVAVNPCNQTTQSYAGVELAAGPMFLSDLRAVEPGSTLVFTVPTADSCEVPFGGNANEHWVMQLVVPAGQATTGFTAPLNGARLFVPASRKLCVRAAFCNGSEGNVYWAGFRPYSS